MVGFEEIFKEKMKLKTEKYEASVLAIRHKSFKCEYFMNYSTLKIV